MKYLLDTNAVIALLNNNQVMIDKLKHYKNEDFALSSIVMFELYFGAEKSKRVAENLTKLKLIPFEILQFNEADAKVAGRLRNELNSKGTPIGAYDILIAGQSVNRNLILITNNTKEFNRIVELSIEDWL